jgi:hypothetical protein
MFERFTNEARRVVVLAQEESRKLNHDYIGTEHLVLGLLHEGKGTGGRALESMDITLEAARREVETRIGRGSTQPAGHIPFTPRAKKSLELSLRESLALGQEYIGTGHLLLGLIRKGDGVGVEVLVSLGADLNVARERVIELLQDDKEHTTVQSPEERITPRPERHSGAIAALLDVIDTRLSAIERHLGIIRPVPDELRAYDRRIVRVVGLKEDAVARQDFEEAAALREQEKRLRSERARVGRELEEAGRGEDAGAAPEETAAGEGAAAAEGSGEAPAAAEGTGEGAAAGPSSAGRVTGGSDEVARLRAEVVRLTALLREHGIDLGKPQDPPAAAG